MNAPIVDLLLYQLVPCDGDDYARADPLDVVGGAFEARLEGDLLTVRMTQRFASLDEARAIVDPFVRAWELTTDLRPSGGRVRFKYLRGQTAQAQSGGRHHVLAAESGDYALGEEEWSAQVSRVSYPVPDFGLRVSPDVRTLWDRHRGHVEGREPLLSLAGFVVSMVDHWISHTRASAGKKLRIEKAVLNTLGRLAASGGPTEARKAPSPGEDFKELSREERIWLEAAVEAVILQAARHAAGGDFQRLTMGELPELP